MKNKFLLGLFVLYISPVGLVNGIAASATVIFMFIFIPALHLLFLGKKKQSEN